MSAYLSALAVCALLFGCRDEPIRETRDLAKGVASAKGAGAKLTFVKAPEGDVAALVKQAQADAIAEGAKLIVYVGASWCEPCQEFHKAAEAGKLDAKLPRIRFLEFDLDRDEPRLADGGYVTKYVPLFAVPARDGRASGKQIAGSIKGEGAAHEIAPRLLQILE